MEVVAMTMMMGGKVHRTRPKARRSAGGVPGAFLQGVDGTRIPLTPDDYRRVREFLLAEPERAVADDERITTGEAARILGVSQRTLTRMLDAGMIPYTRMGGAQLPFPEAFGCDRLQAQARRGHIQGVG
ncbi:helix-turn-helix domain-containing protein [Bifidobacterium sp.]|uniref:helix-turn-helix domain-containing protein n=1 Tax=Bifidobacterium sp. TaxID=41200 RepID=UPI00338FE643